MALSDQAALEVERMIKRFLSSTLAPIAALKDGSIASDGHRVLNFQGVGVQVTDDPGNRRVNINILGGTLASSTTTVVSTVGAGKAFDMGVGATPPTNWFTTGFNDSAWSAPVAQGAAVIGPPVTGSAWITYSSGTKPLNEEWLYRVNFTLPAGTISTGSLQISVDDVVLELYVNGIAVTVSSAANQTVSIPIADLTPAATNYLAFRMKNLFSNTPVSLSFRLDVSSAATIVVPYVNVQDQKSSGTNGGTFTSGAWRTRTLNTIAFDTSSIASLASNQVTLPAGTYRCRISAPAEQVNNHQIRLQNITATSTLLTGTSEYSGDIAGGPQTRSLISGRFTLAASSALEVQHQCSTTSTHAGTGASGSACSFGTETYTVAEFWKEA